MRISHTREKAAIMAPLPGLKIYEGAVCLGVAPRDGIRYRGETVNKPKTEQQYIESHETRYARTQNALIDEEDLARFLKGGWGAT